MTSHENWQLSSFAVVIKCNNFINHCSLFIIAIKNVACVSNALCNINTGTVTVFPNLNYFGRYH